MQLLLQLKRFYEMCRINIKKILHFVHFYRCGGISTMVRCIFRKRRLLKPPRIKSKTGCPEVDLLTEFHCISKGLFTLNAILVRFVVVRNCKKFLTKGLFTLNAILVRFVVVRNFIRFLTQAVDENIFHTIRTQTILLSTGCFAKHLTIVF